MIAGRLKQALPRNRYKLFFNFKQTRAVSYIYFRAYFLDRDDITETRKLRTFLLLFIFLIIYKNIRWYFEKYFHTAFMHLFFNHTSKLDKNKTNGNKYDFSDKKNFTEIRFNLYFWKKKRIYSRFIITTQRNLTFKISNAQLALNRFPGI